MSLVPGQPVATVSYNGLRGYWKSLPSVAVHPLKNFESTRTHISIGPILGGVSLFLENETVYELRMALDCHRKDPLVEVGDPVEQYDG